MEIKTVKDYLEYSGAKGLEYCFQSEIPVTSCGAKHYSIVEKPFNGDKYLHVRPLDRKNNSYLLDTIHIPIWQHVNDSISSIPRHKIMKDLA